MRMTHHGQVTTDLPNTRLWRDDRARWQAPPLIIVPTTTSVAAVLVPVKARRETTERAARGRATADLDRALCASASTRVGRGEETGFRVNKETGMKEVESGVKYMLDFKSPIQGLLSVHSRCGLHTRAVTNS